MEHTTYHDPEVLPADLERERILAQLEVAERTCLGVENFRRQLHDLAARDEETFRNVNRRVY
jgi:hypothetical protein